MKKTLAAFLCCIMLFISLCTTVFADNSMIMPRHNNTMSTDITFDIIDGYATANISYIGYKGVTTEARIYVTLEKRTLLLFWNDIDQWETTSNQYQDIIEYRYPVGNGTYRVTVRMEISGTNGATDVIEKEIKAST